MALFEILGGEARFVRGMMTAARIAARASCNGWCAEANTRSGCGCALAHPQRVRGKLLR